MELAVAKNEDEVWFTVVGRVDAFESASFSNKIEEHLAETPQHIVMDLQGVDYLDSSGLAVLVRTWRTQQTRSRRFSLVMPTSESAQRIFSLAGFDDVFDVIDPATASNN